MTSLRILAPVHLSPRPLSRRGIENASASSRLHDERERARGAGAVNEQSTHQRDSSHFGTQRLHVDASIGIEARFAAQVLGQVLTHKRGDAAAARRAYERTQEMQKARFIGWA